MSAVYTCPDCGNVVGDGEKHENWHSEVADVLTGLIKQVGKLNDRTAGEEATHAHDRG